MFNWNIIEKDLIKSGLGFVRPGEILMVLHHLTLFRMELFRLLTDEGREESGPAST